MWPVLNATNATGNISGSGMGWTDVLTTSKDLVPLILGRLWDLAAAPFRHQEMLWIIFPLLLTLLVLEFYFDRHGDEELGWAAAVANSLILFIVAIDLVKHSFHQQSPIEVAKIVFLAVFTKEQLPLAPEVLILILFLGVLGVLVTVVNYYHLLPRKLAFEVSGHPPINFLAYFAIVIVYSAGTEHPIPFDIATLVAGVLLYVLLLGIVFGMKLLWRRAVHGNRRRSIWSG